MNELVLPVGVLLAGTSTGCQASPVGRVQREGRGGHRHVYLPGIHLREWGETIIVSKAVYGTVSKSAHRAFSTRVCITLSR